MRAGTLVALLGPNGAGKTTTVEILEGYRQPDAGEVRVLGLEPRRDGAALRPRIGVMLQQGGIMPAALPRELVRLHARLYAEPADPDGLLELLGLAHAATRRCKLLSGGEKQRLALALALVGRPELLILDEPTAGMDPGAKAAVRALIGDLRAAGRTILLTTHELADVERLADHVIVIDRGRVLAAGTPAELVAESTPALRFRLATVDGRDPAVDPVILAGLGAALGGTIEDDGPAGRHRLAGRDPDPRAVAVLAAWCAERGLLLAEMRTTGGTLEERFLELIAAPDADDTGHRGADGRRRCGSGADRRAGMNGPVVADVLRPGDGRPSSAFARVAAMLEMELRLTSRRLENLLVTLLLPAVLLVFFGSMEILPDAETALPGAAPIDGVLPAVLATAIVAAGLVNLGISTGFERSYGVLKRLGASPLTRGQLMAAKIGTIVVIEAIQAIILVGLAVGFFGWAPGRDWSPPAVVTALALGTAAFSALGLLFAGTLRAEATMALTNALFLLGILLGGLLVPAHQLPGLLGALASLLPTAALADALRIGLGASTGDLVEPLVVLALWAVGTSLLTARTFRWE